MVFCWCPILQGHRNAPKEALQRNCGGYLACLDLFLKAVPKEFADKALVDIHKSFFGPLSVLVHTHARPKRVRSVAMLLPKV